MAREKFDGVIETVRYTPDGMVEKVRIYEKRGPTFSDRLILTREELVQRLKNGKKFMTGERVPYVASTFNVSKPVQLIQSGDQEYVVVEKDKSDHDDLGSVPLF